MEGTKQGSPTILLVLLYYVHHGTKVSLPHFRGKEEWRENEVLSCVEYPFFNVPGFQFHLFVDLIFSNNFLKYYCGKQTGYS